EQTAARLAAAGGKGSVLRLAISSHGAGGLGVVPMLLAQARKTGVSAYVGDGLNPWHAVHRLDAARLYRLVLEGAPGGQRYHAVGEQRVPFRAIAQAIGARLGLPVVSVAASEATAHLGFLGGFASTSLPASNDWTRAATGWQPREAGLLADIATAGYF
ncbi:MAG: 3-beta hydroxysteroid dehydrogenase, partial [Pseudorhodobacter sp.]|nr:3-beta hydroxysteroid dehydrogenase [Pseudorhodobacter sp.]